MPSVSKKQRRFMGAEYARAKAGEKTQTGMSKSQLRDFASTKESDLPASKHLKKGHSYDGKGFTFHDCSHI